MAATYRKENSTSWGVRMYNEITKEIKRVGNYINEEDAINKVNELNAEHFNKHPYLLPKAISVSKKGYFKVCIQSHLISEAKIITLGSSKSYKDILEIKKKLLNSLVE